MGRNAGAFLGVMLCGYIGEKKYLGAGIWSSRNIYVLRNVAVLFHTRYFGEVV
jgi:hypothetical protein